MGVGGIDVVSCVTTETIVERPPSLDDAPATPNAVPSPMTGIAGATKHTRANQRFMALARGWTVTGLSRHLSEGVGATRDFLYPWIARCHSMGRTTYGSWVQRVNGVNYPPVA